MKNVYDSLVDLVGHTPIIKLNKLAPEETTVYLKLESFNPGGSVKDRIAKYMIEEAEKRGELKPGATIIEPTSGNTGVGLAMIGAIKGYEVILTMPETMSLERRKLLAAYGAKIVLTPGGQGMKGAIDHVEVLKKEYPNHFVPSQFDNMDNPGTHRITTAIEIIEQLDGQLDYFIAGVGTGGTLTGTGEVLKEKIEGIKVIAIEPAGSAVISGDKAGPHNLQGIGAGFIPNVLNTDIIDEVVKVKNEEAYKIMGRLAKEEGLLVGISSGAAVYTAIQIANREENKGKKILAVLPDTGERYLSMDLY